MWTWNQSNGNLSHNGQIVGIGFSGHKKGRNNPAMERVPNIGPCPRGLYAIGAAVTHPSLGPVSMPLHPEPGTDTFGRSGFWIHGLSFIDPLDSSQGCLCISPWTVREKIATSGDTQIEVV
jgi:Protein of unknown function (DUF2778)